MTQEQRNILAHILVDPDIWYSHVVNVYGVSTADTLLAAKVLKWKSIYEASLASLGVNYKNRAQIMAAMPAMPPPETIDQIYDRVIQSEKVLKAYVLCINDGSIAPGSNRTPAQLKTAVKAKM